MYVRRLSISNVRAIELFEMSFPEGGAAGWHVLLGANGSGKSSVVRSLALALAGPREAAALRQNWSTWRRQGCDRSTIGLSVECDPRDIFTKTGRRTKNIDVEIEFVSVEASIGPGVAIEASEGRTRAERSVWGTNQGWFSASFGPFRRFTGGDQAFDRLFLSNPRLASHLSAFGEDVALTEGLRWLRELRVKQLEASDSDGKLLGRLTEFLNNSDLLPHGAKIAEVRSEEVLLLDAGGARVAVEQMSDGYRSILSMIFEILRQMTKSYGVDEVIASLDVASSVVSFPGVVAIDEVDAHLHPSWQKEIGPWFTRCFPEVQFIVTTHSPIICQNASTVWRLASPGSGEPAGRVEGAVRDRLIYGSILDAYGTEFFGRNVERSDDSKAMLAELGSLNRRALRGAISQAETDRMVELRRILPTQAADVSAA